MSQIIYLNGRFLPIEQAYVPVLDRGFIFGDGVYEVIPVYSKRAFRLREHLARLEHSLAGLRMENPRSPDEWEKLVEKLIRTNESEDQSIYLQVTRGPAPRDHAFPKHAVPTVFMMSNPLVTPSPAQVAQGVSAVSATDIRWDRCDIKAIALLPNVLLRQMAVDAGAAETILFRDGILTEGSASNIFAVENGVILAPPKDRHMLPGITYDVVLELAKTNGIPFEIGYFAEARIRNADELWITSSTREILAIVTLDSKPVGDGKPGPVFHRMYRLYQDYKNEVMRHG
ncbi:D-alanine transaminase [Methylophilaceae bacterium]|nr:D-alanine transaminase [Methylophilaceae bacterium]